MNEKQLSEDVTRLLESLSAAVRGERPDLDAKITTAASAVADVFRALLEPIDASEPAGSKPAAPKPAAPKPDLLRSEPVQRITLDE